MERRERVPGVSKSSRPPPEPLLSARGWPERGRDNRTESSEAQEYLRDSLLRSIRGRSHLSRRGPPAPVTLGI